MAFKVFDLECDRGHLFEGWFASHDDYDAQQARGLVACPVCDSRGIVKRLSAPRLNVAHLRGAAPAPAAAPSRPGAPPLPPELAKLQAEVLRQVRQWVRNTEDVGPGFAAEARRIHDGEADDRPIRGTATADERAELAEEGIAVMTVPTFLDDDQLQ
ncbi:DUF1178 family protein [Bordetella genomosp. 5]|uniref:Uncharacterized protein n=1 Tax=Bordetella genomosp. 5 TaxID=1395608 RepID=A0A261TB69_9BORD|nr:DUF1178 family protein [Bordetella genomosp. 5]OZI46527.1 hypothetical protein CAL25_17605 [Bordetella genomosp. 5]